MAIWKSPFNKIVRSKEALFLGLLLGLVLGAAIEGFLLPIKIKGEVYNNPAEICGNVSKVENVTARFYGTFVKVECTDGRKFKL